MSRGRVRGALDRNTDRASAVVRAPRRQKSAKPVIDPNGSLWESLGHAARAYGLTFRAISYRAREGVGGWRFAEDR